MEFEKTSFYNEYLRITTNGNTDASYHWSAVIIANGKEIMTFKVVDMDIIRDYVNNYADVMLLSVMMLAGDYVGDVYPYRDDLELVLYKAPLSAMYGDRESNSERTVKMTYKAVLKSTVDVKSQGMSGRPFDRDAMNLSPPITVDFDLVRKPVMQLRMITCGMPFRNLVPADAVKSLLTLASKEINGNDEEVVYGVSMVEPNNTTVTDHVIIPQGTPLIDVPGYVQKNCNGIYTNGIGFYVQGNYWHVYAPFDVTRYKTVQKTITVIRVPEKRFEGIDRTWALNGDNLTILASGSFGKNDSTTVQKLDEGVGAVYADASKFMDDFVQVSGNKAVVSRRENNNEFVTENRSDGFSRAKTADNRITSNFCVEQSKLSIRNGSVMTIVWHHSDPELIEPCMPIKVILLDNDRPVEIDGVVLMSDTQYRLHGIGAAAIRHSCVTALHVFYKPTA